MVKNESVKPLFFDTASTTPCSLEAFEQLQLYTLEHYGNPSSGHQFGQSAAQAIRDARRFFAHHFQVSPEQVIFTGSGSESDNLAIYGSVMNRWLENKAPLRVICGPLEHPAVKKTIESLKPFGVDIQWIPVNKEGHIIEDEFLPILTPETFLVTLQQVNNITGIQFPIESIAQFVKQKVPTALFHTDSVQAFGKVELPKSGSQVDMISISGHKIGGPKGIGALVVLNESVKIRPLIWGGEQENGIRSGTQNAGLIAGFHVAAENTLSKQQESTKKIEQLNEHFKTQLLKRGLLLNEMGPGVIHWNSPQNALPHIVSLSVPGYPSFALSKILEERGCLVSTGSACSSQKAAPDSVLMNLGFPQSISSSAIRVSFSASHTPEDIHHLANALEDSIQLMHQLMQKKMDVSSEVEGKQKWKKQG